jgi:lipoyl(octanoyl) transferase
MSGMLRIVARGMQEYSGIVAQMEQLTNARTTDTTDELWWLQHYPVFTQGTSCQIQPRKNPLNIPVMHTSRGGNITYHGPGQLIQYLLLDLKRMGIGPKKLVTLVEQALIDLLNDYALKAERLGGAPGVYVNGKKIAALGFRIRNGCCFHGLSLNVDMDSNPFGWIDPCGLKGMEITQLTDFAISDSIAEISHALSNHLGKQLGLRPVTVSV